MTAARPDTWMPLYWGDYLRDTAHLSAAEHGAYLLLIGHYWTNGGPFPDDNARLARIARMSPKEWKAARPIIAEFFDLDGGSWRHKRIDTELERALAKTAAKAEAGKKGAEKRWQTDGTAMAQPPVRQWQIDAPSQSPSDSSEANASSGEGTASPPPAPAKQKSNGHGTRLPADWCILPDEWKWAQDQYPEIDLHEEEEKFRDYWLSQPGSKGRKVDWSATFRNWIRKASEYRSERHRTH